MRSTAAVAVAAVLEAAAAAVSDVVVVDDGDLALHNRIPYDCRRYCRLDEDRSVSRTKDAAADAADDDDDVTAAVSVH